MHMFIYIYIRIDGRTRCTCVAYQCVTEHCACTRVACQCVTVCCGALQCVSTSHVWPCSCACVAYLRVALCCSACPHHMCDSMRAHV